MLLRHLRNDGMPRFAESDSSESEELKCLSSQYAVCIYTIIYCILHCMSIYIYIHDYVYYMIACVYAINIYTELYTVIMYLISSKEV